jgi:hypothetical protein
MKLSVKELQGKSQEELLQIAQHVMDLKKSRQAKKLDDYAKTMHKGQEEFHKLGKRICFIFAGNRCLRGDTKVWTSEGLQEISKIKEPTNYLSLNHDSGEIQFSPGSRPFPKGKENLYRVVHEHGEFYASGAHRIFSFENGYQSVLSLKVGDEIPYFGNQLQTISESYLSKFLLDAQRLTRKVSDCLDDCEKYIHRYGLQLLQAVNIFPTFAPSQVDAQESSQDFCLSQLSRKDGLLEQEQERSRLDQSVSHLSSSNSSLLEGRQLLDVGNQTLKALPVQILACIRVPLRYLSRICQPMLNHKFFVSISNLFFVPYLAIKQTSKIISIEKQASDETYWDIQIADTNNYFDESGVCHHNSGKTTAGAVEMIWTCMGLHPFKKNKVPLKTAIVGPDFSNWAQQILEPKIKEWSPSNSIRKIDRHQGGAMKRVYWTSGSTTDVFSHDQDPIAFEGSDYDVVWFDEPPPHFIWKAFWRSTVDRGGRMYMSGTPLMSPWLYEVYQQMKNHDDPIRDYVKFERNVNAKNLGGGDVALGLKRIEEFAAELTEEEKASRLDGDFAQVSGLIFKDWDRTKHVITPFDIPVQWPIYESIDPHPQKDWAVSWIAHAPNGAKILVKSIYANGVLDEIANQIIYARGELPIKDNLRLKITRTFIDNASSVPLWQKSNTDPTARRVSVREELENMIGPRGAGGPRVEVCPKNVAQKIDILKQWLHIKKRNEIMRPDFFVFANSNDDFIHEIENWAWDRHKSRGGGELKDKPVKKNDDLLDSVMQVALVLGSKPNDTNSEIVSLIDGLGTYGGSNFGTRRNLEKRQDARDWQN